MSRKVLQAVSATLSSLRKANRRPQTGRKCANRSRIENLEGRQYMSDSVWMEDAGPVNDSAYVDGNFAWVTANPPPHSGTKSLKTTSAWGLYQTINQFPPLKVGAGDKLFAYVYIDPTDPPEELLMQFTHLDDTAHRAYWGVNYQTWPGTEGTDSLRRIGDVPTTAGWNRLEIPVDAIGLQGKYVNSVAFYNAGGAVAWDTMGIDALNVSPGVLNVNAAPQSQGFTFDEAPSTTPALADLALENLSNNTTISDALLSTTYNATTKTGTLAWPNVNSGSGRLTDGNYELTLSSETLATDSGKHLGGDGAVEFYSLDADFNRDRSVDTIDYAIFFANNGTTSGATFAQGDANLDGAVDSNDYVILSSAYGRSLAAPPSIANNLKVTNQHTNSLDLYWQQGGDTPDGWRIYRSTDGTNFTQTDQIAATDYNMAYTATGLEDGTKYWFRVRPYTVAAGNGLAFTKAWGVTQLASPIELAISNVGATTAKISWTTPTINETGFKILVSTNGGPFLPWVVVPGNHADGVNSCTLEDLLPGTSYAIQVSTFTGVRESAPSVSLAFNTSSAAPPSAPSDVYFEVPGVDDVALRWTDTSNNETGFRVQRSTDGNHWLTIEQVQADQSYCILPFTSAEAFSHYRVAAMNDFGVTPSATLDLSSRPHAPINLAASFASQSSVHLTWDYTADSSGLQFEVQASGDGQRWVGKAIVPGSLRQYDLPATSTTLYRIRVFKAGVSPNVPETVLPEQATGGPFVSAYALTTFFAEQKNRSSNEPVTGIARFTRAGPTNAPLTAYFNLSGTATSRRDYGMNAPGYVTFPAGQSTVDIAINPAQGDNYEGPESVIIDVIKDPTNATRYAIGSHPTTTLYLKDYADDPDLAIATNERIAPRSNGSTGVSDFSASARAAYMAPRGELNYPPGGTFFDPGFAEDSPDVTGLTATGVTVSSPGFKVRSTLSQLSLESTAQQQSATLEITFDKAILSAYIKIHNAPSSLQITEYRGTEVVAQGIASNSSYLEVGGQPTGVDRISVTSMTTHHLWTEDDDFAQNSNPLPATSIWFSLQQWLPTGIESIPSIVRVNSDWDEHHSDGSPDLADTVASLPSSSAYGFLDDELSYFMIRQIPSGANASRAELLLSDRTAVRLFTDDGSLLFDASQAGDRLIATPNGTNYLSGLYFRSKRVWFEALLPQSDFTISLVYFDKNGDELARSANHILFLPRASGDLSIDSNNDGAINSSDSVVEDAPDTFGKLIPVLDGDRDGDKIPDWADGFQDLATLSGDSQQADPTGAALTSIELSLPSDINPANVAYSLYYDVANPRLMTSRKLAGQDHATWTMPASGSLRIWTRNGTFARTTTALPSGNVPAELSYLVPSTTLSESTSSWNQLALASGGNAGDRKIVLWIEAVRPATSKGSQTIHFEAHDIGNLSAVQAQDEVHVTAFRTVDSWRQQALKRAGLQGVTWDPSLGFDVNEDNARKVYDYYASLYLSDPQHFQWAGLARLAGRAVVGALKTSQNRRQLLASDIRKWQSQYEEMSASIFSTDAALAALSANIFRANLELDSIQYFDAEFLKGQRDIFMDLAWQHEAFRTIGLDAIKAINLSGDLGAPSDVVGFWQHISSNDPTVVAGGNRELAHREQFDIIQPTFDRIAAHYGNVFSPFVISFLSKATHSLMPGMHDFVQYAENTGVDIAITSVEARWEWFINDILPAWESLNAADRGALVKQGL